MALFCFMHFGLEFPISTWKSGIQAPMAQGLSNNNHLDNPVDSDQNVVNEDLSLLVAGTAGFVAGRLSGAIPRPFRAGEPVVSRHDHQPPEVQGLLEIKGTHRPRTLR